MLTPRRRRSVVVGAALAGLLLATAGPAAATYPGCPGRVVHQGVDVANGHLALFSVEPDGSHRRQLTRFASADVEAPDVSPDGSRVAFDSDLAGSVHVFTVRAGGSGLTQVTYGDGEEYGPSWSPDGHRLLLERVPVGAPDGIFALDLRTGTQRRLTTNPFGAVDADASYSPDGRRVVFTRVRDFAAPGGALSAVFVAEADGTHLRRLTPWAVNAAEADWSPDGRTIAFNTHDDRVEDAEVFTVRPDGSGLRQLTRDPHRAFFRPCWSPDGRRLVLTSITTGSTGPGPHGLFTMNPDGSGLQPLVTDVSYANQADWGARPRH